MKNLSKISLVVLCPIFFSSCLPLYNTTGVTSAFYVSWKDRDPITRVDNSISDLKKGKACVTNIMGLHASGDSSVEAAKKAGGIKNISYVDRTYEGVSFFYQKGCTIVNGN